MAEGEDVSPAAGDEPAAAGGVAAALAAYEIGEELGRGGWGVVLAGRHRRLGREVAIKQLPALYASDPDVRARFLAEGQRLASLDHPHIVPVYDYVEHGELCLLVMERLTGGTVAERAAREQLAPEVASGLVLATCSALQHAHEHGLLHRDIKPANLLFAASGALKVADFGIAKVLGAAATTATADGTALGTPAFMAPEQVQGGELTPATDVYALGTTLYWLLARRLPFPADGDPVNLLFRRVHEAPDPLHDAAPELPAGICDLVDAALARDPAERIASAQSLGVALAGAAAAEWGPHWLEAAGVVLAAGGPIAEAARGAARSATAVTLVPKQLDNARELYESGSWSAAFETLTAADGAGQLKPPDLELLATCSYMLGNLEGYLSVMERVHQAHLSAGARLPAIRAAIWIGLHLFSEGQPGRASGWLARVQRLLESEGTDCAERGYLLFPASFEEAAKGNHAAAAEICAEAAAIGERFGDAELVALGLSDKGQFLIEGGAIAAGLPALDEAMLLLDEGEVSPIVSGIVYCGVVLACQGAHDVGRAREWTRALSGWCDAQPDMVAFTGRCRMHRAELMLLEGAWPDAIEEAERARVRSEQAGNRRSAGAAAYVRGEAQRLRGDLAAADESFRQASGFGYDPQPGLALLWLARGDAGRAASALRRARAEAPDRAAELRLLPAYVEVMLGVGDVDAARDACDRFTEAAAGSEGMLAALAAQARGRIELAVGEAGAALASLRRSVAIWQELGAPYEAARTRLLIGAACAALGDEGTAALELDGGRETLERLAAEPGAGPADPVERARAQCETGAWNAAFETLTAADQTASLHAADLELLARAATMLGRDDDSVAALERAYAAYVECDEALRAGLCAFWIGFNAIWRGDAARAQGWFGRAQRTLEPDDDCALRGYLLIPEWLRQMSARDYEGGYATAAQAEAIGERSGDTDLTWLARMDMGRALIAQGRVQDGLRLVDEALVVATAGELSPQITGIVHCNIIGFCRGAYELRHAHLWTEALTRWCERQPEMVAHNGVCLVHRAEMIQLKGDWTAALEEAERVAGRFTEGYLNVRAQREALYRQGEIQRVLGRVDDAEARFRAASAAGREPQPGLALLRLAQGKVDAAAAAIRRAVLETGDSLDRAGLVAAQVEIALAAGDVTTAHAACLDLAEVAERQGCEALAAMSGFASGAVALAEGDATTALVSLRGAFRVWHRLEAPYEAARARELIGLACRALGDEDSAQLELGAAREAYERLGAAPDLSRLAATGQTPASAD